MSICGEWLIRLLRRLDKLEVSTGAGTFEGGITRMVSRFMSGPQKLT